MKQGVNKSLSGRSIFVGLSGGVDSAVTAALVQKTGANVTGVFIKGWYPPGMPCTWAEDRRDAMRVAAHLQLPFITLDASEEYRKGVIEYLIREYKAGRTPNPDIMCNREVKFGAFHSYAKAKGLDFIATGHYAQTDGTGSLFRGTDLEKDQSYFLWAVPRTALSDTLFPLGALKKSEVRKLAQKFKLPNAMKRDSQGICFLGNISVEEFLTQEFGIEPGRAIDTEGNDVGTHQGVLLSTLGQRIHLENSGSGPWYVVAKDITANILIVSHEKAAAHRTSFLLEESNWISNHDVTKTYAAQYRYHGPSIAGLLSEDRKTFVPNSPVLEAVASGQSLVIYDGEECVGGGIIA